MTSVTEKIGKHQDSSFVIGSAPGQSGRGLSVIPAGLHFLTSLPGIPPSVPCRANLVLRMGRFKAGFDTMATRKSPYKGFRWHHPLHRVYDPVALNFVLLRKRTDAVGGTESQGLDGFGGLTSPTGHEARAIAQKKIRHVVGAMVRVDH